MQTAVCPACQRNVKLPPNTSSRAVKTMCPKCGELLTVPPTASRHPQDAHLDALAHGRTQVSALSSARTQLGEAMATTRGLGLLVVLLGLLALSVLAASFCLPAVAGYVGLPLAGLGILLGTYASLRGLLRREREALYAAGGLGLCGLALALILTHRPMEQIQKTPSMEDQDSILNRQKELR